MSMNKKAKKKFIILTVTVVLLAAFAVGLWFFVQYQSDSKTVEVVPMNEVTTQYWADESHSSGTAVSDYVQELYPPTDQIISEVFVQEGQEVKIGDQLLQYDKTKLELEVEAKEIAVKEADLKIDTAQKQLKKLQATKPVATAGPTSKPTSRPITPTAKPTAKPTASPSPTPVPPADVTLYSRLDLDSEPYSGSGTTDDPYLFLCTEDCIMTPEFLKWLLGAGAEATPAPTAEPTPDPDGDYEDYPDEEDPDATPTPEPTPAPTPRPSNLASPFAAVFEVRDGNSNYGSLISAFKLDGTRLSASFQISDIYTGSNSLESVAGMFGATPTPTPNPNNYNDMGYTSAELKKLIAEKKQEIKDLQLARKQANLNLDKANLQLKNSTVLSNMDGIVKTLTDLETATANNAPFLVVSGDNKYYISGVISENLLGSIKVGDSITAMAYQTGMSYTAQIVSIADYPVDSENGMYYSGSGNPNSSNYEFTAVVDQPDGLTNGMNLDITMSVQSEEPTEAIYVWKAYIRDDDAGSYVMKAGINNRLIKQYLEIGKSIYGGEYIEAKSGLTMNDFLAFPYGADVKEGVRVRLKGSEDGPMSSGAESSPPQESGVPTESGASGSAPEDFLGDDGEGNSAASSDSGDAGNTPALPDGAVIVGGTESEIQFKTENGGGVILQ